MKGLTMAQTPIPVLKISGTFAIVIFLYVTVIFGALHLLAISKPDNKFFKAWLGLGF